MKLIDVEYLDGVKESTYYDAESDRVLIHKTEDVESHLLAIRRERESKTKTEQYKGNLVKSCNLPFTFIEQMKNGQCCNDGRSYNFWSRDKDEQRRTLIHVQLAHPGFLYVDGKPFAKERAVWH